nr:MAG TPA: hypothetical protein [Caudoviricetes sp.]
MILKVKMCKKIKRACVGSKTVSRHPFWGKM